MAAISKEERKKKEIELENRIKETLTSEMEEKYRAEIQQLSEKVAELSALLSPKNDIPSFGMLIPVICNTDGELIYISKKTPGYCVTWHDFGDTEYMELGEIEAMRNTDIRFFKDNWIVLGDTDKYSKEELYKILKVEKYYANIPNVDIDKILQDTDSITQILPTLSDGMKQTAAARAYKLLTCGKLDKNTVDILQRTLKMQFEI